MPPFTPCNYLSKGVSDPAGIKPFFQRYRSSDSCVGRKIFLYDKHPAFSGICPMTGFHHGRFSGAYTAPGLCSGFSPDSLNPAPVPQELRRRITTQHIQYVTAHPKDKPVTDLLCRFFDVFFDFRSFVCWRFSRLRSGRRFYRRFSGFRNWCWVYRRLARCLRPLTFPDKRDQLH